MKVFVLFLVLKIVSRVDWGASKALNDSSVEKLDFPVSVINLFDTGAFNSSSSLVSFIFEFNKTD